MTHGDDDGLRLPPIVAPRQIVLIPMLRDKPEDAGVLEFCDALAAQLNCAQAFGEPVRALVDRKADAHRQALDLDQAGCAGDLRYRCA